MFNTVYLLNNNKSLLPYVDCQLQLTHIDLNNKSKGTNVKKDIPSVKHQRSIKLAVCGHVSQGTKHYIKFDKPHMLAKEHRFLLRMIYDTVQNKKHSNSIKKSLKASQVGSQ